MEDVANALSDHAMEGNFQEAAKRHNNTQRKFVPFSDNKRR
jgi:hypothetical protein